MKKMICLCLMLIVLVVPVSAAEVGVYEAAFPVGTEATTMRLCFYGNPGAQISYEVLAPGQNLPSDNLRATILNSFGMLGQVRCDQNGVAEVEYVPERGDGIYKVRANGAKKIICAPDREQPSYFAFAWSDGSDGYDEDVLYPMYELTQNTLGDDRDPVEAAELAAEALRAMPEGRRAIRLGSWYNLKLAYPVALRESWNMANSALSKANADLAAAQTEAEKQAAQQRVDSCQAEQAEALEAMLSYDNYGWWDKGGQTILTELSAFFEALAATGVTVDYFICDFEEGMSIWSLGHDNDKYLPRYQAIEQDERYQTDIRPMLAERGFVFCEDDDKCELYYACHYASKTISPAEKSNYLIFNAVMNQRKADYMDQYIFAPYLAAYPQGKCANYNMTDVGGANMYSQDYHASYKGGHDAKAGTHASPSLYGKAYTLAQVGYNGTQMPLNGFSALLYNQNLLRSSEGLTTGRQSLPWVARENYISNGYYYGDTPWYYENILHTGLLDPDAFLFWGPRYYSSDNAAMVKEQAELFADMLRELELMTGTADRHTLETELCSWNRHFLLTGMEAGGKRVWHITPDVEGTDVTVENFCQNRQTPTFQIDNTTITFPGCSILTVADSRAEYGYWVVGSEEAEPVITRDEAVLTGAQEHSLCVFRSDVGIQTDKLGDAEALTVRWNFNNQTTEQQVVYLLAAGYQNDKLSYVRPLSVETVVSGAEGYHLSPLTLTGEETEVRIFLWSSGMSPLLSAVTLAD